jgi:hypothetical protein
MLLASAAMSRAYLLGTSLLILFVATPSLAADKDSKERAARKACLSGDYAKGVEILSDLFLDTKNPTHIFNQARCYEQNSRCGEAVSRFREYLRKAPDLKTSERSEVERHIEECETLLEKTHASSTPAPVVEPPPPSPPLPPAAPVAAAPVAPPVVPPPTTQVVKVMPSKSYGLVIAGACTGLVGLGSVGVGLYYYDRARFYSARVSGTDHTTADENSGKQAETMQWIFFGFGGAAVAAGTVMTILGWPSSEPSTPTTSFAPMVGPGLAGIAAQGTF